jgi:leader peptidase (prepilin peptidase) / N-methyltransferase
MQAMLSSIPQSTIYALLTAHFIAFGSFLGAAIFRLAENPLSLVTGLSGCRSCGAPVRIWHMVPVFSWLALRGRCLRCHSPLSPIYPIVEGGTLVSFILALIITTGPLSAFAYGMLGAMLLALAIMEIRVGRLSEALAIPLALIGLGLALLAPHSGIGPWQSLFGAGFAALIVLAAQQALTRQILAWPPEWGPLGRAEAMFLVIIGFWTGIAGLALVLALGLALKLLTARNSGLAGRWPLGAFLAGAAYLVVIGRLLVPLGLG